MIAITCHHCGEQHVGACHRIRAIEYQSDGVTIKRVEYHAIEGLQAPVVERGNPDQAETNKLLHRLLALIEDERWKAANPGMARFALTKDRT